MNAQKPQKCDKSKIHKLKGSTFIAFIFAVNFLTLHYFKVPSKCKRKVFSKVKTGGSYEKKL